MGRLQIQNLTFQANVGVILGQRTLSHLIQCAEPPELLAVADFREADQNKVLARCEPNTIRDILPGPLAPLPNQNGILHIPEVANGHDVHVLGNGELPACDAEPESQGFDVILNNFSAKKYESELQMPTSVQMTRMMIRVAGLALSKV